MKNNESSTIPLHKRILEYLTVFRTRKEIEEKFKLSNTQSWRILKWLKNINLIIVVNGKISDSDNRRGKKTFYKKK